MEKEMKTTAQTVSATANDALAVSMLLSMKPGDLFRFAAELASTWDLRRSHRESTLASRRYIE
jgi:hypothetical protein